MSPEDRTAFGAALRAVGIVCNRRVDDEVVDVYFRLLSEKPITDLVRALEKFARTAETGRRFPSPKEIRDWMPRPYVPPSAADAAWRKAYAALTPAWWTAHWAAEDERTGRWRKRRNGSEG